MGSTVVCVLALRDAEPHLPGYFDSVAPFADAVVALDLGSSDHTRDVLRSHSLVHRVLTDGVLDTDKPAERRQVQHRLLQAAAELDPAWILELDVRERISPSDGALVRRLIEHDHPPRLDRRRVATQTDWREAKPMVYQRLERVGRRVALTFDDGDSAPAWAQILDVLEAESVKATFFCSGMCVARHRAQARRTLDAGHHAGSHAWDHRRLPELSRAAVEGQLLAAEAAWSEIGRVALAPYFRPPYGAYDWTTLSAARGLGYRRIVNWDVEPFDWMRPPASVIAERAVSAARPGSIVLLHVLDETADALPSIIRALRARNLDPTSLAELFDAVAAC